jgi:hypothetical protein
MRGIAQVIEYLLVQHVRSPEFNPHYFHPPKKPCGKKNAN